MHVIVIEAETGRETKHAVEIIKETPKFFQVKWLGTEEVRGRLRGETVIHWYTPRLRTCYVPKAALEAE